MRGKKQWKQVMAVALSAALLLGNLWLSDGMSEVAAAETTGTEQSCAHHTHDEECGYDEETGTECTYECPVCKAQGLIDALPEADGITKENAEEMSMQLGAVDEAMKELTEEQTALLSMERYTAAAEAVSALEASDPQDGEETDAEEGDPAVKLQALIDALPAPSDIDPENEEQIEAIYHQIGEIYAFAGENGFDVEENETINAVIAAAWPAESLDNAVARIGETEYATLTEAFEKASDNDTITILSEIKETKTAISFTGKAVTLDLNGQTVSLYQLTAGSGAALKIVDQTATTAPSVDENYHVSYTAGKLEVDDMVLATAGGTVTLESGIVDSGYIGLYAEGDATGATEIASMVTVTGGYVAAQEFAITAQGKGAVVNFQGGVAEARDNAVIAGNGTERLGGTVINISGGTLIGHITTAGYVSCGVYHPQEGELNITGGTIYSENGCGILMRGGTMNMTGGTVIAQGEDTLSGKVGDARVVVSSSGVVLDRDAKYYDAPDTKIHISGDVSISGNKAALEVINSDDSIDTSEQVSVTGGTYSSDVSEYVPDGYAAVEDGENVTIGKATEQTDAHVAVVNNQYFTNLQTAIDAAGEGETVKLLKTVTDQEVIAISDGKKITLDLNNCSIGFAEDCCMTVENGELNLTGTGTIYEQVPYYYPVEVVGSTDPNAENYSVVHVGKDVTLEGYNGISVQQKGNGSSYGVVINVAGTLKGKADADGFGGIAMNVNGTVTAATGNVPKITIEGTARLTAEKGNASDLQDAVSVGMYLAGYADTTVEEGASITGGTGVEIRAGKLTVNGGTISGTETATDVDSNGNGSTVSGAGIAVSQHTTKLPISVTINGGRIEGYSAFYESNPQKNSEEDLEKVQLNISDGKFIAINGGTNAVYSEDVDAFVSGGEFSSYFDETYLAPTVNTVIKRNGTMEAPYVVGKTAEEALKNVQEGDVITLLKFTGELNVPEGVKIENKTGVEIIVNGKSVANGAEITSAHTMVKYDAKAATCTQDGNSEYYHCSICGKNFADENGTKEIQKDSLIIKASHTYGEWTVTKEATGTTKGEKQRTCSVCGAVEKAEIPALGHKHGYSSEWEWDGKNHWHECSCGEKTDVAAHTYSDWTVTKQPTADKDGMRETSCTVCGYRVGEPIPATGSAAATSGGAARTGDESMPMVWTALLVMAGAALVIGRKKYNQ